MHVKKKFSKYVKLKKKKSLSLLAEEWDDSYGWCMMSQNKCQLGQSIYISIAIQNSTSKVLLLEGKDL